MKNRDISILCIDDEEPIRFALSAVIETQGWTPFAAKDVSEGLRIFDKNHPDLVLIDYHMPGINGIYGVSMLRQRSSSVPIIVFTIDENQEIADRFMEVGASDFATKPIKAPDLISRMKLHIRLLQSQQANAKKAPLAQPSIAKGICVSTLELIIDTLSDVHEHITVEEIAHKTGLAYQTTYRYLQHMDTVGIVDVKNTYGKIGRPKQGYCLIENL